ncbi:hypothetical protein [Spirosoma sp. KNUC1025]|uniref:hypothetical protein n=1 Tax=Spirosoma sp. KNUC1025 TaxID=2894082 RepID=UPI00386C0557|nr:hypothetical protein LN737_16535 [Spirosoma sp. KNUC1025]
MEPINDYADRLNHLSIDLRAEVVLADMVTDGVSLDDLILNPMGAFRRATGRDINDVSWVESERKVKRWLQINLNRSGLYDLLPEGVFHQPTTNNRLTDKEDILQEMTIQRQRELAARQFFLPIDQEFLRQRVQIELESRQSLLHNEPDDLLVQFWSLPEFLTPEQSRRLQYLLPLVHQLAGNMEAMTECFEQLVDERISLQLDTPGSVLLSTDNRLGEWQLGDSSVFDGWLQDEEPLLRLTIHIEQSDQLANYLPGQNGRRLIEWLSGFLVPLDVNLSIELNTSALHDTFLLTDDDSFGRLSFTTYVSTG